MTEAESKLRQRTEGRPDRSRDHAILNAALSVLTERGYNATNMNYIPARAGVGKAATSQAQPSAGASSPKWPS
jgi:DNA-binding transcriptional regulator YbjK